MIKKKNARNDSCQSPCLGGGGVGREQHQRSCSLTLSLEDPEDRLGGDVLDLGNTVGVTEDDTYDKFSHEHRDKHSRNHSDHLYSPI
jgi:hypothetical protein